MNIGRRPLTDTEFTMLWTVLYQEFYMLSMTNYCNASVVYNTIYTICTSTVPYEDKLYWKIGDFLYNRCKEHRARIEEAQDYIKEYAERFALYESLVKSINKLSCFLNECVRGRKIDDFGYLLWERSVIQNLPKTFYEDVFQYGDEKEEAETETHECTIGNEQWDVVMNNRWNDSLDNVQWEGSIGISSIDGGSMDRQGPGNTYGSNSLNSNLNNSLNNLNSSSNNLSSNLENDLNSNLDSRQERYNGADTYSSPMGTHQTTMKESFSIRGKALLSFSCIVPDPMNPLLYYREKYEKMALRKIKRKYKNVPEIKDLRTFANTVHEAVSCERSHFHEYFLHESSGQLEKVLSDCLLADKDGVVQSAKEFIASNNAVAIVKIGGEVIADDNAGDAILVKPIIFDVIAPLINKPGKPQRMGLGLGAKPECSGDIYGMLVQQLGVLSVGYTLLKKAYAFYVIETINDNPGILSASIVNIYNLFNALDIFSGGAGEADSSVADLNTCISAENNRIHFGRADEGTDPVRSDFRAILIAVTKYALQRVKPCFITRLCSFSEYLAGGGGDNGVDSMGLDSMNSMNMSSMNSMNMNSMNMNSMNNINNMNNTDLNGRDLRTRNRRTTSTQYPAVGTQHPIDTKQYPIDTKQHPADSLPKAPLLYKIFYLLAEMVADQREFMNIYHIVLRDRLLGRSSCIKNEIEILQGLGLGTEDRLFKMILDMEGSSKSSGEQGCVDRLTLLNHAHWGIEADGASLRVPSELMESIIRNHGGTVENGVYRIKEKVVKMAHQFSKIRLGIDGRVVLMNIYQYAVVDALRQPMRMGDLAEYVGVQEHQLAGILMVLEREGIVRHDADAGQYWLCRQRSSKGAASDISAMQESMAGRMDICVNSYLQVLCARILKRMKRCGIAEIVREIVGLSKMKVDQKAVLCAIDVIIEKGIGEVREGVIEYVL